MTGLHYMKVRKLWLTEEVEIKAQLNMAGLKTMINLAEIT